MAVLLVSRERKESLVRWVEFRGGRFLAWLFLALEPVLGLRRAQALMAWLITHRPFWKRDIP